LSVSRKPQRQWNERDSCSLSVKAGETDTVRERLKQPRLLREKSSYWRRRS